MMLPENHWNFGAEPVTVTLMLKALYSSTEVSAGGSSVIPTGTMTPGEELVLIDPAGRV